MSEPRHTEDTPERDALTGLPGVEAARTRIESWRAASPEATTLHALLLGLRRIDAINLAYGAAVGDAVLVEVAARITRFAAEELDGQWLAARGGGSRFRLVAMEPCSRERWQLLAGQLAETVARSIVRDGPAMRLVPRLALLRGLPGESAELLLDRLAQTLARVERGSGPRVVWADGEAVRAGRTAAQLEADLAAGLERDEIEMLYQPQFSAADDELTGAEALARWNHPLLGRVGASALFAVAEHGEQTVALSRHIARLALAGAAQWPKGLRLSLNVTPAELGDDTYAATLLGDIAESGFDPARLTLEVTEQLLVADLRRAGATLEHLADAGLRIALDDFGAGFCNFRYLKLLPLDYLKLDRSMVDGIAESARDLAVLRAIVAMAGALGLEVIAEGVETEAQRAAIAAEGCGFYQGFLRAQPLTATEFANLAKSSVP
ncbi:MAG: EAL domain-containing protein [Novosphingobium sp.]|nr:EAL domain-containing protein [Novosphingobium sp.]